MMCDGYEDVGSGNPLKEFLERHLCFNHAEGRIFVHVMTDLHSLEDWRDEPYGPHRGNKEHLHARQVVLVFQAVGIQCNSEYLIASSAPSGGNNRRKPAVEHLLIMGFSAWEYAFNDRPPTLSRVYLQYVDTTGLFRPRKLQSTLTRNVITCYIKYCQEVLQVPWIHLYVSSSPSLLFPGSEKLLQKGLLSDTKLLCWWLALIHCSVYGAEAYVYFPGEEHMPQVAGSLKAATNILNSMQCGAKNSTQWKFSSPFHDILDSPRENIPLFEDDPKWRHFEAVDSLSEGRESKAKRTRNDRTFSTVREFLATLSLRTEFRQKPSAFIAIRLKNNNGGYKSPYYHMKKRETAGFIMKILNSSTFHTEPEALKSSLRCWSWLQIIKSDFLEISDAFHSNDDSFIRVFGALRARLGEKTLPCSHTSKDYPKPFDVQNLIRRKVPEDCPNLIGGNGT